MSSFQFYQISLLCRLEEKKWKYNIKNTLEKPKELRKSAFQLTIENDWHGNAYLMLATDCIPFIEAFRVCWRFWFVYILRITAGGGSASIGDIRLSMRRPLRMSD